jgi:hypothetical protein
MKIRLNTKDALIVVDVLTDFLSGGALNTFADDAFMNKFTRGK